MGNCVESIHGRGVIVSAGRCVIVSSGRCLYPLSAVSNVGESNKCREYLSRNLSKGECQSAVLVLCIRS